MRVKAFNDYALPIMHVIPHAIINPCVQVNNFDIKPIR